MAKSRNLSRIQKYESILHILRNKYYNLYRANFKWKGIDYRQEDFIMNKYWNDGTVAAFNIKNADELGFAGWVRNTWDMYGEPETINLLNVYGSPLIPESIQVVDKDVVLGYIQSNKKPLKMIVDWYLERIAQVEMVINTNLQLQKIPFIIPVDKNKVAKVKDMVERILDDEIVIYCEDEDPALFKAVLTGAPYLIDKLENYEKNLENDLKTFLGINNNNVNKVEQLQLSEVNANNGEIMAHDTNFQDELNRWCEGIKNTLGKDVSVEVVQHDIVEGINKQYSDVPGPKGGQDDEE